MTRIFDDSIDLGWGAGEREKLRALLVQWFPAIDYEGEEMDGGETIEALRDLYEWAGGEQLAGCMDLAEEV